MTSISEDRNVVTLINVFTVAPENQQRLVEALVEATEKAVSKHPGHVSAKSPTTRSGGAAGISRR